MNKRFGKHDDVPTAGSQSPMGAETATISVERANQQARKGRDWRLAALEEFVRMGDDLDSYLKYAEARPTFFPVLLIDLSKLDKTLAWDSSCHRLVLAFRDALREVWQSGSNKALGLVLGFDRDLWKIINDRSQPSMVSQILGGAERDVFEAMRGIPNEYIADLPQLDADWWSQNFRYSPKNDFQTAIYSLWHQSWRARVCRQCNSLFIADKPPQMYCSTRCYGESKGKRSLAWWRAEGADRRKRRAKLKKKESRRQNRNRQVKSPRRSKR